MFFHNPLGPIILIKARSALGDHLYSHRPEECSPSRALSVEVFRHAQPNVFGLAYVVPALFKSQDVDIGGHSDAYIIIEWAEIGRFCIYMESKRAK